MGHLQENLPSCSLMIATYNWPEALHLCLLSAIGQSLPPNEILIADDGSTAETKKIIDEVRELTNIPLIHIWHPDEGFQLSAIRNKAINAARFDYLIQVDGDVILERNFVDDHLKFASKGAFLCGSRISLTPGKSIALLETGNYRPRWYQIPFSLLFNSLRMPILTSLFADRYKRKKLYVLRGCNMSFWRSDLLAINGYNEDIKGWGSEDFELAMRLINKNIKKRFLKFSGIVYHIYHKENSRESLYKNESILKATIQNKSIWANNGIMKSD